MSLIEQLGSYEAAKTELNNMPESLWANKAALAKELLDYRREHGIFEVGDKVIFKDAWLWSSVFTINQIIKNLDGVVAYLVRKDIAPTAGEIRHASSAEIEAGRRL